MDVYLVFYDGKHIDRACYVDANQKLLGAFSSRNAALNYLWGKGYLTPDGNKSWIATEAQNGDTFVFLSYWTIRPTNKEAEILGRAQIVKTQLHGSALEAIAEQSE